MDYYTKVVLNRHDFLHLDKVIAAEALKPVTEKCAWRLKLKAYAHHENIAGVIVRYGGHALDANGYVSRECHEKYSDALLRLELRGWLKDGTSLPLVVLPVVLDGQSFGGERDFLTSVGHSSEEEITLNNVLTIGNVQRFGQKESPQYRVEYHGKDVLEELRLTTFKLHTLTVGGNVMVFNQPLHHLHEQLRDSPTYPVLHVLSMSEVQAAQNKFKALCFNQ